MIADTESISDHNTAAAAEGTARIGELLVARGKLDNANLERALKVQEAARAAGSREKLGSILTRMGLLSHRELAVALAAQHGWAMIEVAEFPELPVLEETVSSRFIQEARSIPVAENDGELVLAMVDPQDTFTVQAFAAATGKKVVPKLLTANDFDVVYERLYGAGKSSMGQIVDDIATRDEDQEFGDIEHLKDLASEAPVIRLVNLIINHALERR
ncbi:MAG: hypothetical protein ACKO15_14285, partial [Burkholderiales bacterium]